MPYVPTFDEKIRGYATNVAARNAWRYAPLYEIEDLQQESYLVFVRCAARYPIVDTPQHFMALFKSAWSRHLVDLARKASAARAVCSLSDHSGDPDESNSRRAALDHEIPGDLANLGEFRTLLRQAPAEVRLVLQLVLDAPAEFFGVIQNVLGLTGRGANKIQNAFVAKALGLPEGSRPLDSVREFFGQ